MNQVTHSFGKVAADRARSLLEDCHLPLAGLFSNEIWASWIGTVLLAVAGMETFGDVVLLRSVATAEASRGQGLARFLCASLLTEAKTRGAKQVFLLTETAEPFFQSLGFQTVSRDAADSRLLASAEFQEGRCASAKLMSRRL